MQKVRGKMCKGKYQRRRKAINVSNKISSRRGNKIEQMERDRKKKSREMKAKQ